MLCSLCFSNIMSAADMIYATEVTFDHLKKCVMNKDFEGLDKFDLRVSSLFTSIKFNNLLPTYFQPYVSIETRSLKASQLNDNIRFKPNITQNILSLFFICRIMHPTTSSLFCELDKLADFTFYTLEDFSVNSVRSLIDSSILLQDFL